MYFQMAGNGFRADMRQYVGPPTVAAVAQMIKGGVQVNMLTPTQLPTVVTKDIDGS